MKGRERERERGGGGGKGGHCSSCISEAEHSTLEKLYNCQILHRSFIVSLYYWLTGLIPNSGIPDSEVTIANFPYIKEE